MLDLGWSELLIIFTLALVILGPKELPKAIRKITGIIKQVRGLAREFQTGLDDMVKDTEFEDARNALRDVQKFNPRNQLKSLIDPDDELDGEMDIDFDDDSPAEADAKRKWRDSAKGKQALGETTPVDDDPAITEEFPVGEVPPAYKKASTDAALTGGAVKAPKKSTSHKGTKKPVAAQAEAVATDAKADADAPAPKKAPSAKKAPEKKASTKKAPTKKAPAKKPAVKKPTSQKTAAKKTSGKTAAPAKSAADKADSA